MNALTCCFKPGHSKRFHNPPPSELPSITNNNSSATLSDLDHELIEGLSDSNGQLTPGSIQSAISSSGLLYAEDPRLSTLSTSLSQMHPTTPLTPDDLRHLSAHNPTLLHKVASCDLTIPNFTQFCERLIGCYHEVEPVTDGEKADYIPLLRDADPEKFAVAFCSVDGQYFEYGDVDHEFTIQSTSKPITFAKTIEKQGVENLLFWCGVEPSGRPFSDGTLMPDGRPFNPMVNSGALMTTAVLASGYPDLLETDVARGEERLYGEGFCERVVMSVWRELCADGVVGRVGFSEETFLSERRTAHNNFSIAHRITATKGLPAGVSTERMVDYYLRACSVTANTGCMAVMAATLANTGRNPVTGNKVFEADTVKKTLSVVSVCGFYDNAGEFFFFTGKPTKTGVSGVVFLVLPNIGGFAFFSPRLDEYGHSVRGRMFAERVASMFTFQSFGRLRLPWSGPSMEHNLCFDLSRNRRRSRRGWAFRRQRREGRS